MPEGREGRGDGEFNREDRGSEPLKQWRLQRERLENAEREHWARSGEFRRRFEDCLPAAAIQEEIVEGWAQRSTLTGVMLDNSTLIQALIFATCKDSSFGRWGLSDNRQTVIDALTLVIESLVLHERVFVGPGAELRSIGDGEVGEFPGLKLKLDHSASYLQPSESFWIMSIARRRALDLLGTIPDLVGALEKAIGTRLSPEKVKEQLESISVSGSDASIHKIEELIASDRFYLEDMSSRLLFENGIATYGSKGTGKHSRPVR
jgi:hypothetical protein